MANQRPFDLKETRREGRRLSVAFTQILRVKVLGLVGRGGGGDKIKENSLAQGEVPLRGGGEDMQHSWDGKGKGPGGKKNSRKGN